MPLTPHQKAILKTISANRNPNSIVAGGLPLARTSQRLSHDIDLFHDSAIALGAAAAKDLSALKAAGFTVELTRNGDFETNPTSFVQAEISRGDNKTILDWAADSDYRYFPAVPDAEFGYVINPIDLAMNKLAAATDRSEIRDIVDLNHLTNRYLPLGALVAASTDILPGFTPEAILNEMSRNIKRNPEEWKQIEGMTSDLLISIVQTYRGKINAAREFIAVMPTDKLGRLFLEDGVPVQPDLSRLADYTEHKAQRAGHWPHSSPIANEMLAERYGIAWDREPHRIVNPALPYPASTMDKFAGMSPEAFLAFGNHVYHVERSVVEIARTQELTKDLPIK